MKVLVIRFSSFGDIVQAMGVPAAIRGIYPNAEIHWVTKTGFSELLQNHPHIKKVWSFDGKTGAQELLQLAKTLKNEGFTHVYDAHNNLRSHLLCLLLGGGFAFLRRPKSRWARMLMFYFKIHLLPRPFIGQMSFIGPLEAWKIPARIPSPPQFFPYAQASRKLPTPYVVLVPRTAWRLKEWPIHHWRKLIEDSPRVHFVILGGPGDVDETRKLERSNVSNLAGKLSLMESCAVLNKAAAVVSADTGFLHVADQLGKPVLSLIGPTAFGYPAQSTSKVLEIDLPCKPCSKDGRGRCKNQVYKACLEGISPQRVGHELSSLLNGAHRDLS